MRRCVLGSVMALVLVLLPAAGALADARVGIDGGVITVGVIDRAGADGAHAIVVEPFQDAARTGWRVRQQAGGNPPFSSIDADCDVNTVANDVVCRGARSRTDIGMGDGNDRVLLLRDEADQQFPECTDNGRVVAGPAAVRLGAGADVFESGLSQCPLTSGGADSIFMPIDARGGPGNDRITGAEFADTLRGEGEDDILRGGSGNDTLSGGPGTDTLRGESGDEDFVSEAGPDTYDGGPGRDGLSYAALTASALVDLGDDASADGPVGELDRVLSTVEDLVGGSASDNFRGSAAGNRLAGGAGDDQLSGQGGSDTLVGGPGRDVMTGGDGDDRLIPEAGGGSYDGGLQFDTVSWATESAAVTANLITGRATLAGEVAAEIVGVEALTGGRVADQFTGSDRPETFNGFLGGDTIEAGGGENVITGGFGDDVLSATSTARDEFDAGPGDDVIRTRAGGEGDVVSCGDGIDRAEVDLLDPEPSRDCETVTRFAVDDGPPARVVGRRIARGRTGLTVACPKRARIACRGRLVIRRLGGRRLDRARYRVPLGARRDVAVALPRKPGRRVVVTLTEPGVSEKGPRTSIAVLRVRR